MEYVAAYIQVQVHILKQQQDLVYMYQGVQHIQGRHVTAASAAREENLMGAVTTFSNLQIEIRK